jgi:hypothetical protein
MTPTPKSFLVSTLLLSLAAVSAVGAAPRALEPGKLPADVRLQAPKDLNGYFPFTPAESREAWAVRADPCVTGPVADALPHAAQRGDPRPH